MLRSTTSKSTWLHAWIRAFDFDIHYIQTIHEGPEGVGTAEVVNIVESENPINYN
jgi:hypothetical protein